MNVSPHGAEDPYYQQLKSPYKISNGPMRTPGELRLVKDFNTTDMLSLLFGRHVEPTTYADLGSPEVLVTPYPGSQDTSGEDPKVNLNTVDLLATEPSAAVVLSALIDGLLQSLGISGSPDSIVQDILEGRRSRFQNGEQFRKITEVAELISSNPQGPDHIEDRC